MNLNNKVAVVTGGASGLGRAAAQALVERGATVVIFDMNAAAGETAVQELGASKARFMKLDVSSGADVEAAFAQIVSDLGRVDVCVNCAGIGIAVKTISREGIPHDLDLYRKVIEVNLIGTFNIARCAAAAMARNCIHCCVRWPNGAGRLFVNQGRYRRNDSADGARLGLRGHSREYHCSRCYGDAADDGHAAKCARCDCVKYPLSQAPW